MILPAQAENNAEQPVNREIEIIMLLNAILPVWLRQLGSIKEQTEDAVEQLTSSASAIVKQFDRADSSGHIVRSDIESLLLSLQYQDRINQTLSVIIDDISRLQHILTTNSGRVPASDEWLNELSNHYTMHDERDHHLQTAHKSHDCNAKPDGDEVTFF